MLTSGVEFDCSLKKFTSMNIGGPAAAITVLHSAGELRPLLLFMKEEGIPWRVIGKGTNIIVKDEGFDGVIIILGKGFKKIVCDDTLGGGDKRVKAGGGHSLSKLSSLCADRGLSGLEFSCGIPGTIGGAVIMNAGAWGGDIARVADAVTVVTASGKEVVTREKLDFGYRSWPGFLKYQGKGVVTEVEMILSSDAPTNIQQRCRELMNKRRQQQPISLPNAGSIFKNPPGDSAGRLIDLSGLKGTQIGGATVSRQHGNFIVNTGNATARDLIDLMDLIQEKIKRDHNVELKPEVHFI